MSDGNQDLEHDSVAEAAQDEEEQQAQDEAYTEEEEREDDEHDTDEEEEVAEEAPRRQLPVERQRPQNRQERRQQERQQNKQTKILPHNDRRNRPPQEAAVDTAIERYDQVENPSSQLLPQGVEASRAQQLLAAGELQGIGRKTLLKAASRMQAYRTAFIEWQAQREDYVIFQNAGSDPESGKDRWEPMHYRVHFLTMGQRDRLDDMNGKLADLQRAATNNDTSVKDVHSQIRKTQKAVMKYKLKTYFRMYIGEVDANGVLDPDDEFERSSAVDVRDMLDSAEWCFQWVPKSRRIKPSEASGSKADTEYDMIR